MNHHEHQHQLELPSPPNTPLRRGGVVSKRRRFTHTCSSHQHLLMPSSPSYTHEKNITHTQPSPKTLSQINNTRANTHTHTLSCLQASLTSSGFLSGTHTRPHNTPTRTMFHTHKKHWKKNPSPNINTSPSVLRWPWQRQGDAESEDCRALWFPLRVCGRTAEEEDDPQRHQQQEVEPDR